MKLSNLILKESRKNLSRLLCITALSTCSVFAYGQQQSVKLSGRNVPLKSVFKQIEKQTNLFIDYKAQDLDDSRVISKLPEATTVDQALRQLLNGTGCEVTYTNGHIIIQKKASNNVSKQSSTLKGTIVDENDLPIIGANVLVKGTTNGTITDVDGNFSLDVANGDILFVSYIGYVDRELKVGKEKELKIVLKEDTKTLDEVVVVGYGVQKKVNLTGSITAIKTKELENIPVSNLSNSLAGRAPGVTITNNSGFAGASSSIRIRGSQGEPLYVINGIIRDKTAFDALDPNEVESINILKDAASASIYGSKAGNGVVLVTTKKGSIQKPMFQYKASYTAANTTRPIQDFSATDELIFANRAAAYQNSKLENPDPNFQVPYGPEIFDYFKDKSYNLNDLLWQNPWNTDHNISVNGGNERITYYMMAGYHGEEGSYKNTDYNRYNFRSDITAKITDAFKVNFNVSGNQRDYKRFYWPYDWDPESMTLSDFYRTTFNQSRLRPWYVDAEGNPSDVRTEYPVSLGGAHFGELVFGDNYEKTKARDVEVILKMDLDLGQYVKGLSTSVTGQYNISDKNRKRFATWNKSYKFQSASQDNIFIPGPVDPDQIIYHNLSHAYENIQENVWLNQAYQFNWMVNYDRKFGKHQISGLAGWEMAKSQGKYWPKGDCPWRTDAAA